jgi:hypothetical protein
MVYKPGLSMFHELGLSMFHERGLSMVHELGLSMFHERGLSMFHELGLSMFHELGLNRHVVKNSTQILYIAAYHMVPPKYNSGCFQHNATCLPNTTTLAHKHNAICPPTQPTYHQTTKRKT